MTRHLWVESKQVPSHLRCTRVLNKRSAAKKANSNTVVSGRVFNKAKKPRSVTTADSLTVSAFRASSVQCCWAETKGSL